MGEVAFRVGAESMAASWPHGVMAPTSSNSFFFNQLFLLNLQILLDFLGLESIDSRFALEKLHGSRG